MVVYSDEYVYIPSQTMCRDIKESLWLAGWLDGLQFCFPLPISLPNLKHVGLCIIFCCTKRQKNVAYKKNHALYVLKLANIYQFHDFSVSKIQLKKTLVAVHKPSLQTLYHQHHRQRKLKG